MNMGVDLRCLCSIFVFKFVVKMLNQDTLCTSSYSYALLQKGCILLVDVGMRVVVK